MCMQIEPLCKPQAASCARCLCTLMFIRTWSWDAEELQKWDAKPMMLSTGRHLAQKLKCFPPSIINPRLKASRGNGGRRGNQSEEEEEEGVITHEKKEKRKSRDDWRGLEKWEVSEGNAACVWMWNVKTQLDTHMRLYGSSNRWFSAWQIITGWHFPLQDDTVIGNTWTECQTLLTCSNLLNYFTLYADFKTSSNCRILIRLPITLQNNHNQSSKALLPEPPTWNHIAWLQDNLSSDVSVSKLEYQGPADYCTQIPA